MYFDAHIICHSSFGFSPPNHFLYLHNNSEQKSTILEWLFKMLTVLNRRFFVGFFGFHLQIFGFFFGSVLRFTVRLRIWNTKKRTNKPKTDNFEKEGNRGELQISADTSL